MDTSLENLLQVINTLLDRHVPLKQLMKREIKTKSKPWLETGFLMSIHIKNKIHDKFCKSKDKEKSYYIKVQDIEIFLQTLKK